MFSDRALRASMLSIVADLLLIAIKSLLAWITGSVALIADALHSISDVIVSISAFCGIALRRQYQKRGQEKNTPRSGYWIEATIAAVVSLLILYMPYEIINEIRQRDSQTLQYAWIGILGTLLCIGIVYFIARFKIMVGKETDSPALEADGYHSQMDLLTSIAVLVSLVGQMIGIQLDPIVAVVIAVIIAITGIELLLSSIISLYRRQALEDTALLETIMKKSVGLVNNLAQRSLGENSLQIFSAKTMKRMLPLLLLALFAGYAASGFVSLQPWQSGARFVLGEVDENRLSAGLHYHLPSPFGRIETIDVSEVHRVEVGFRSAPDAADEPVSMIWEVKHRKSGFELKAEEATAILGDESLMMINLVVQYRAFDPVQYFHRAHNVPQLLRGLTESSMRLVLARETNNRLLSGSREAVLEQIRHRLQLQVQDLNLGIEVIDVLMVDVHPPLEVIASYRDVFSAREDKLRNLSEAQGYRNESLPLARGQREQRLAQAESEALEYKLHAEGDAQKFILLADAYSINPALTAYRMHLETLESGLKGRQKIVADGQVNQGEYRRWLFSPQGDAHRQRNRKSIEARQ